MEYAKLNQTKTGVEQIINCDTLPTHKKGYLLPIEQMPIPSFDPQTQNVVLGDYIIQSDKVIRTWVIQEKSIIDIQNETEDALILSKIKAFKQSSTWEKMKNEENLTTEEIQNTLRLFIKLVFKKLL